MTLRKVKVKENKWFGLVKREYEAWIDEGKYLDMLSTKAKDDVIGTLFDIMPLMVATSAVSKIAGLRRLKRKKEGFR